MSQLRKALTKRFNLRSGSEAQVPEAPEAAGDGDSADYTLATVVVCVVLFFLIAIGFWSWNTSKTSCAAQRVAQHAVGRGCSCGCNRMVGASAARLSRGARNQEKKHRRKGSNAPQTQVNSEIVGREAATAKSFH
jgi:hypothetical protein